MSFKLCQNVTITKLFCCFTVQTHAKLNNFNSESDPWPISDSSKNFLKNYFKLIASQCLGYRPVEYSVKGTDIECTTIECILPWVMRNWVGCKKFRVVGYTSSDVDIVCTTTGTLDQYHCQCTQPLGTLVVVWILCTQPLGIPAMILILGAQPLGT